MNGEPVNDRPRLIERGFPLRETSLASVHEKNVRHGHISTLHIWPARRPLAACRAALIATLLPDPGDPAKRAETYRRLAGTLRPGGTSAKDIVGGILQWGTESGPDLEWFREQIREAYSGRAPRVLDPFAGGGAIPLEAMRLGCETTALDINPVAWFVLKCTLEYPQRFGGKRWPLPSFASATPSRQTELAPATLRDGDLADHVRAWGGWVLDRAGAELASYYPTIDGKLTVAYLWARTVRCKGCRAIIPLLKTRWLSRTSRRFVILEVACNADRTGVSFAVRELTARESARFDARGTMTRTGAKCPCCPAIMSMEELRLEGRAGRMGTTMTVVVVEGARGKEHRLPTALEIERAAAAADALANVFSEIPYGVPNEPTPTQSQFSGVANHGLDRWDKLFTPRQLLALGTFLRLVRHAREQMTLEGYGNQEMEAISSFLACALDRAAAYLSSLCTWEPVAGEIKNTFGRYALPMYWDFAEGNPTPTESRIWAGALRTIDDVLRRLLVASAAPKPDILRASAISKREPEKFDVIVTDPPYYDAIPYSDLMDFFYIWLRRALKNLTPEFDDAFAPPLSPKWDTSARDGELIDDASRFHNDRGLSRRTYEDGMYRAFQMARDALTEQGRFVVVFANKNPEAWETLVSAIIRAGFVIDGSWPILTEMRGAVRNFGRASLASSIWLVATKRNAAAVDGWDTRVRDEMRSNIRACLREFWDAGIRGPDFVWSAVGPALQAYSKHPRVKKVDEPGVLMEVSEFLIDVRREVVAFAAARVLATDEADEDAASLDGPTTYYLLHRNDFGFEPVPVGGSILYAISCGLRDTALVGEYDLLERVGKQPLPSGNGGRAAETNTATDEEGEEDNGEPSGTSKRDRSSVRLKTWDARGRPGLGEDAHGRSAPLIDQIHRLMRLWKAGDAQKVDAFVAERGIASSRLVREVIQALIEFSPARSEERSILEGISNQLGDVRAPSSQPSLLPT